MQSLHSAIMTAVKTVNLLIFLSLSEAHTYMATLCIKERPSNMKRYLIASMEGSNYCHQSGLMPGFPVYITMRRGFLMKCIKYQRHILPL